MGVPPPDTIFEFRAPSGRRSLLPWLAGRGRGWITHVFAGTGVVRLRSLRSLHLMIRKKRQTVPVEWPFGVEARLRGSAGGHGHDLGDRPDRGRRGNLAREEHDRGGGGGSHPCHRHANRV